MADFIFRPHRATYDDAMALAQSFASWQELEAHLGERITKIDRYVADPRNDWDTHIVMTASGVAGFTNGPVADETQADPVEPFHRNLNVLSWEGDGKERRFVIDVDAPPVIGYVLEDATAWPVWPLGSTGCRWSQDIEGKALVVADDQPPPAEGVIISCSYEPRAAHECDRCRDDGVEIVPRVWLCFDCYDVMGQNTFEEFVADLARWQRQPTDPHSAHDACVRLHRDRQHYLFEKPEEAING
jgi:hypothetical protein